MKFLGVVFLLLFICGCPQKLTEDEIMRENIRRIEYPEPHRFWLREREFRQKFTFVPYLQKENSCRKA
jgi:hypothetical protein